MKKITLLTSLLIICFTCPVLSQNGLIGGGFGTNNWTTTDFLSSSAGTSRIGIFTPNGTGNQYFRLVTAWNDNYSQWGPNSTSSDYAVSIGIAVPAAEIIENSTTKAYYINTTNTAHKYVFKTKAGGNPPASKGLVVFKVEGDIRSVASVSRDKSTAYRGQSVNVTAELDGSLPTGQGVYLRYTADGFASSTVIAMSGSGTTYTATIPANVNTAGTTVAYYIFTSGSELSIPSGDADWYTINLNNNGGSNYSYTINNSYITSNSGNWSTASNWADGVPPSGASVIINHDLTLDQAATVGSLTINSGKTFTASDATTRTLIVSKSASGSTITLANSGTWANGAGGSTVVFSGEPSSGDAIHAITGTIAFQNITVNKTGGSSNVGAGFDAGSSVNGTLEVGNGGFISSNPPASFYGENAILAFNQGNAANYEVNSGDKTWSTTIIPNNITVSSGTVTLNDNRTASGNLVISSGAVLLINAAKQLTLSGTATNNGTITIQSDANGTGTIVGNVSGTATVNQHLSSYRTWYLSSPVSNVTPANMNRYKFYDEATNTWTTTAPAQTIGAGFLAVPTDNAVTSTSFSGTLNNGAIAIPLIYSAANTLKHGFNLVGNPYPSYLDWTAVYAANTSNLSTSTLWYRTKAGAYTFWTVNGESGEGSPAAANKEIAPMQAFWVRTAANGSLNLSNTLRSHAPAGGSLLKAPAANSNTLIRFEVSNGTNTDETVLYFNANASNEFDVYDSPKMSNEDADIAEIYTRVGNERLVMNGMPAIQKDAEIALGFQAGNATSFSLRANEVRNLASDVKVILKDNVTQTETDLTDGTGVYAFGNLAASGDRFSIIFRTAGAVTGIETPASDGLTVYNSGREQLTVLYNGAIDARTTVSVYNAVGQRLANQLLTGTTTVVNGNFIPGVYVMKVNNLSRKLTIKN